MLLEVSLFVLLPPLYGPPGVLLPGLVTVTATLPAVAMAEAGMATVSDGIERAAWAWYQSSGVTGIYWVWSKQNVTVLGMDFKLTFSCLLPSQGQYRGFG
jgi:hypothetical protein